MELNQTYIRIKNPIMTSFQDFTIHPTSNSSAPFHFESSDESVATIDPNSGEVHIENVGSTTIIITQESIYNYTSAIAYTVLEIIEPDVIYDEYDLANFLASNSLKGIILNESIQISFDMKNTSEDLIEKTIINGTGSIIKLTRN